MYNRSPFAKEWFIDPAGSVHIPENQLLSPVVSLHGLCKPVAFPGKDNDMGIVDQSINQSGGDEVVSEHHVPLRMRLLRS